MYEEINSWLNSSKEYFQGCALYNRYGHSVSLKRLLNKGGATSRNKSALEYELRKLIRNIKPPSAGTSGSVKITAHKKAGNLSKKQHSNPNVTPGHQQSSRRQNTPEVDELNSTVQMMQKHRASLQSTLELLPTDADRCTAAHTILDLSDKIDKAYERLSHYDKHGILPLEKTNAEKPELDQSDVGKLYQRMTTLRTYVSRYEGLVKKSKKPETLVKNQDKLNKYKIELKKIEDIIKK